MLMHQGIGLEQFNAMPQSRAVHALFECCCNVTWANKVAEARPFANHQELVSMADKQLFALSDEDVERIFDSCIHEHYDTRTADELAPIMRDRIAKMLGPEGGFPQY
jgi:2-oxo-4-hydroxy-4-carboxy-5-ureidoimidazoline decarboxylase